MGQIPPAYCDMEMMYHYILMNEMKLSATQAAEYSIHGLKHFLITAATQLEVERTAIEKLGHWHHGSKMPDKYNQSKCVQELVCRTKIQKQFAAGWRPVGGSELANEWIVFDEKFSQENDAKKKKVHGPKSFICKFSQAKLKAIAQRRVKATSGMVRGIKRKKSKPSPVNLQSYRSRKKLTSMKGNPLKCVNPSTM